MRYFIDTNIFLRVLIGDDKNQFEECTLFLKAVKNNRVEAVTATIVLAEIAWTLSSYFGFSKQKTIQGVRSIINLRGLKIIDRYDHLLTLFLYEKYSVKYIDALIASNELIQNKELCVVSYDADFDKLSVLRKEPAEAIRNKSV